MGTPLFLLNLKSYPQALGAGAARIGLELAKQGERAGVPVALAPATPDLAALAWSLPIPVLAQHVDALESGARTGSVVPEAIQAAGGRGSLINHSERPVDEPGVASAVDRLSRLGLVPVVCAPDVATAARLAVYHPPYLAVEPPELIGGELSVSTARPEVVAGAVQAVRKVSPSTHVLCGAGIHDRADVHAALSLGAEGILVASAVTRSSDPARAIRELLAGFAPPS